MKTRAFTLVELLLVIAVISILAAVGIMSYRRYFQVNRIDKVAISMQHVLEAAMAFYVDNDAWPSDNSCDGPGPTQQEFINNYLPNASYRSYYGTNYCWEAAGNIDPKRLFWVALNIPGAGSDRINIAKRLASRLPNAITTSDPASPDPTPPPCDNNNCYVRAEITVPGASTNAVQSVSLAASGDCHSNTTTPNASNTGSCADTSSSGTQQYTITFDSCPVGTAPNLRINPNFITVPRTHVGPVLSDIAASPGSCTSVADPSTGQERCDAQITVTVCTPNGRHDCLEKNIKLLGGQVGASYMVACVSSHNKRGE